MNPRPKNYYKKKWISNLKFWPLVVTKIVKISTINLTKVPFYYGNLKFVVRIWITKDFTPRIVPKNVILVRFYKDI